MLHVSSVKSWLNVNSVYDKLVDIDRNESPLLFKASTTVVRQSIENKWLH